MTDSFTIEVDDSNLRLRLQAMPDRVRAGLRRAVTVSAIDMQAKIQAKLAGPVLKERTHHLHDSIHYEIEETATSVMATDGTNVSYAHVHEDGGIFNIPAHMRRLTMIFGKPLETPRDVLVRAHTANFPQKSFLRSTLREETPAIQSRLEQAVRQAVAT